ncbi:MAG: UTP--glucose-1-phosphate uridylyltransferase GalU [bacterium]|nr:MAG: UTP--glucose-1-phosphate uridylyltransferase GalU [bacterium]
MRVRKAVIPAAGMGTRFLPLTKASPKELLPLLNRPVIHAVVEEATGSGVGSIILITGMGKNAVEDYFDISPHLERTLKEAGKDDLLREVAGASRMVDVVSVRQKEQKGLGHAVLCAREAVGEEPFAVLLPDDVFQSKRPCIGQLLDPFERFGKTVIALQEVPTSTVHRYGIIDGEEIEPNVYRIKRLVEKPSPEDAPSNLAAVGRYILPPETFRVLDSLEPGAGGEIQLTDALDRMAGESEVYGLVIEGTRHDMGNIMGFLTANIEFALADEELGPMLRAYLARIEGRQ